MPFQSTSTVPSTLPPYTVQAARDQWSQGRYAEAWNTLAQAGDRYADNAAAALCGPSDLPQYHLPDIETVTLRDYAQAA